MPEQRLQRTREAYDPGLPIAGHRWIVPAGRRDFRCVGCGLQLPKDEILDRASWLWSISCQST